MSFFKDFKADFTQAMNELMPDGNEMYDEDEIIEESSEKENKKEDTPVKQKTSKQKDVKQKPEKKTDKPKKEKVQQVKSKKSEPAAMKEDSDIAPEDMLEQIDDLLEDELYSDDERTQMLLDDDVEVNTMDMSVEELLSQLSEKQEAEKEASRQIQ